MYESEPDHPKANVMGVRVELLLGWTTEPAEDIGEEMGFDFGLSGVTLSDSFSRRGLDMWRSPPLLHFCSLLHSCSFHMCNTSKDNRLLYSLKFNVPRA